MVKRIKGGLSDKPTEDEREPVIHYIEYSNGDYVNTYQIIEHDFNKKGIFNQRTVIFESNNWDEIRDTLDQVRELKW